MGSTARRREGVAWARCPIQRGSIAVALVCAGHGCGDGRNNLVETWDVTPAVRVLVAFSAEKRVISVLGSRDAFELSLSELDANGNGVEVWAFAYAAADLKARYPALRNQSDDALSSVLSAQFGPLADEEAVVPREVLYATVEAAGNHPVEYARASWSAWTARVDARASPPFAFVVSAALKCAGIVTETFEIPSDFLPRRVVAMTADRAMLVGHRPNDSLRGMVLFGLSHGELTRVSTSAAIAAPLGPVTWDRTTSTAWGTDERKHVFSFDDGGRAVLGPDLVETSSASAHMVWVGSDGTMMGHGQIKTSEGGGRLYERAGQHWREYPVGLRGAPFVLLLRVVKKDEMIYYSGCWFTHVSAQTQKLLFPDPGCASGKMPQTVALSVEESTITAVGVDGLLKVYDRANEKVHDISTSFGRIRLLAASPLRRGHHLVGGSGVLLAVDKESACTLFTDAEMDWVDASSAPQPGVAYAIGAAKDRGGGRVARVRMR